jgi:phosphopantothenoylcysteine synthetase/decarboxylase
MTQPRRTNVLYHIICAGPPATDAGIFVKLAQAANWDVCIIATPQATKFINTQELENLAAYPIRTDYKMPDEPDPLPQANAIVVAPMTFNTMNKWAAGIADTLATSLLCEYLGLNVPIVAAPNINPALARHPTMRENLTKLRSWDVSVLFDPSAPPPTWMATWQHIIAELGAAPTDSR